MTTAASEHREPWHRRKGETARAYRAFLSYRNFGADRSVTKVVQELAVSRALATRWSSRWAWVSRAEEWDRVEQKREDEARRTARIAAVAAMEDRHLAIARAIQAKLVEKLATFNAADLTPDTMAKWLDIAVKVERLALERETERVHADITVDEPVVDWQLQHELLQDEEYAELAERVLLCQYKAHERIRQRKGLPAFPDDARYPTGKTTH